MRWVCCVLLLLVTGVAILTSEESRSRAAITLSSADVFTMDPQRMSYMQDLRVARALFEGLCARDNTMGVATPGVALSWELSADGKTWTFHLRPDARWTNGDRVTSGDFRSAWRRLLLPDTAADYTRAPLRLIYRWRSALEIYQPDVLRELMLNTLLWSNNRVINTPSLWPVVMVL